MNYGKTIDTMCHIIAELWDEHMLHSLSCVNSFHSLIYDVRYKNRVFCHVAFKELLYVTLMNITSYDLRFYI